MEIGRGIKPNGGQSRLGDCSCILGTCFKWVAALRSFNWMYKYMGYLIDIYPQIPTLVITNERKMDLLPGIKNLETRRMIWQSLFA